MIDFEMKFLNLLEKVTNGSVIEISYTGTLERYGSINRQKKMLIS